MNTIELPKQLIPKYEQMIAENNVFFYGREYEKAREGYKKQYDFLLRNQGENGRFHKGAELFNIASAYMQDRKPKIAFKYFLKAYIEDILTFGKKADSAPASQVLINIYIPESWVYREIRAVIGRANQKGIIINDPEYVVEESDKLQNLLKTPKTIKTIPMRRKVGQFKSSWEKRVFVGGNYKDELVILKKIKEIITGSGYDPVFAEDFDIPKEEIHHHSLMLLHECKKAIFEISSEAGQLLEIERLRDFEIDPLIIYQSSDDKSPPKATAMVTTLCSRYNWILRACSDYTQLKKHIKAYLEAK